MAKETKSASRAPKIEHRGAKHSNPYAGQPSYDKRSNLFPLGENMGKGVPTKVGRVRGEQSMTPKMPKGGFKPPKSMA